MDLMEKEKLEQKVEESGLLENAENMLDYLNQLDESISDSPELQ